MGATSDLVSPMLHAVLVLPVAQNALLRMKL